VVYRAFFGVVLNRAPVPPGLKELSIRISRARPRPGKPMGVIVPVTDFHGAPGALVAHG